jgi:anti-anti-sigma factor
MMLVSTDRPLYAQQVTPTVHARFAPAAAQHDGDRTIIWMYGEHDISNKESLAALIAQEISFDESDVEIDLSGLRFMSCATVHVILRARENLRLQSRSLTLISPTMIARRLLDLCGLTYRSDA